MPLTREQALAAIGLIALAYTDAAAAPPGGTIAQGAAAAKAGAAGFVRAIAKEVGRHGITSNAISLSTLEPQMAEPAKTEFLAGDHAKARLSRYVIRRFGKPDDVAHMALFLCSNAASWITGQTYPVNGGYSFAQ